MSKSPKIILSVKRKQWRKEDLAKDEDFEFIKKEKKHLDKNKCLFCGFVSEKYQESHHVDNNHANNDPSNLVTACPFCHGCYHIGFMGTAGKGKIIYLPEVSQSELNRIIRVLLVCMHNEAFSMYKLSSERIHEMMLMRASIVDKEYEEGWSNPSDFANQLMRLNPVQYAFRSVVSRHLRFLPNYEGFRDQVDYWGKTMSESRPASSWINIVQNSEL